MKDLKVVDLTLNEKPLSEVRYRFNVVHICDVPTPRKKRMTVDSHVVHDLMNQENPGVIAFTDETVLATELEPSD